MRLGRSEMLDSLGIQRTVTARSRAKQRLASLRIHVSTKKLRDLRLVNLRATPCCPRGPHKVSDRKLARISTPRVGALLSKTMF